MNYTTLLLLLNLGFCAEWVNLNQDLDIKTYYALDTCIYSIRVNKLNNTHAKVFKYNEKNCLDLNTTIIKEAFYTKNLQYYIDESYYYIQIYHERDCNDEDFSIPIVGYKLVTREHCNTEVGLYDPIQEAYYDHSNDRIFACYDALGVNSSICKYGVNYPGKFCYSWYEGQCYASSYSEKYFINRRRFETNNVDPMALLVVFIFFIIII